MHLRWSLVPGRFTAPPAPAGDAGGRKARGQQAGAGCSMRSLPSRRDIQITRSPSSSCSRMPLLASSIHSLQLWHFLLLVSAVPPPAAWSLRPRSPVATRPLCARRSPSAHRPICIWDRTSLTERDLRLTAPRQRALSPRGGDLRHAVRLRRQAAGARPATPSGFEDGMPSSQYPWAIVWGPTVSDEDGGDANSANPGFPPLGYTFVSPRGMATAQPNSHSLLHNAGLNLRETPATLRPFLFGPRGEGRSALCFSRPCSCRRSSSCKTYCPSACAVALEGG